MNNFYPLKALGNETQVREMLEYVCGRFLENKAKNSAKQIGVFLIDKRSFLLFDYTVFMTYFSEYLSKRFDDFDADMFKGMYISLRNKDYQRNRMTLIVSIFELFYGLVSLNSDYQVYKSKPKKKAYFLTTIFEKEDESKTFYKQLVLPFRIDVLERYIDKSVLESLNAVGSSTGFFQAAFGAKNVNLYLKERKERSV